MLIKNNQNWRTNNIYAEIVIWPSTRFFHLIVCMKECNNSTVIFILNNRKKCFLRAVQTSEPFEHQFKYKTFTEAALTQLLKETRKNIITQHLSRRQKWLSYRIPGQTMGLLNKKIFWHKLFNRWSRLTNFYFATFQSGFWKHLLSEIEKQSPHEIESMLFIVEYHVLNLVNRKACE